MKNDFLIALTRLSAEKNLPKEVVMEAVEAALVSAFKKDNQSGNPNIAVKIVPTTGEVKVFALKTVVESPADLRTEISLADAKKLKKDAKLDDVIEIETTPANSGRIAAQTAKQVVLQRLREAEREVVFEEYAGKEGDIVSGIVQRIEPKQIIIDLGKAEAVLPVSEQVRTERYRMGQRLKVLLLEVYRTNKGPQLIVSRTHRNLLRRLLELEVPEIYNGAVEIHSIAREAGYRSKVAVAARQEGVDPVGSCVGPRGIRIQNIVNELSGERIDVVQWDANLANFVANALSPAQVLSAEINPADKSASVIVPDKQLSLAIGKEGQNARLAAKLTGLRIDIKSASAAEAERLVRAAAEAEALALAQAEALALAQAEAEKAPMEAPVEVLAEAQVEAPAVVEAPEPVEEPVLVAPSAEVEPEMEEAPVAEAIPVEEILEQVEISPEKPRIRFAEEILVTSPGRAKKSKKVKGKKEIDEEEAAAKPKKARKARVIEVDDEEYDEYEFYSKPLR